MGWAEREDSMGWQKRPFLQPIPLRGDLGCSSLETHPTWAQDGSSPEWGGELWHP